MIETTTPTPVSSMRLLGITVEQNTNMKYRKKPVVIEAIQVLGTNDAEVKAFCPVAIDPPATDCRLIIKTLEGEMTAMPGDWIIKGVKGEFYPCKPDIFAATYEAVRE